MIRLISLYKIISRHCPELWDKQGDYVSLNDMKVYFTAMHQHTAGNLKLTSYLPKRVFSNVHLLILIHSLIPFSVSIYNDLLLYTMLFSLNILAVDMILAMLCSWLHTSYMSHSLKE